MASWKQHPLLTRDPPEDVLRTKIPIKLTWKTRYGKPGNKNTQPAFQHCCKTRWITICAFYHPRIKLVMQQISLLQVAISCCREYEEVLIFATKPVHVTRFTGPRQTCFAASDINSVYGITLPKGSVYVSGELPTYPSPKPTPTLTFRSCFSRRAKCWFRGGVGE